MTRRPVVAVVLVLLAVSIGLAVTLSRPAADRAAEGLDVPSSAGPAYQETFQTFCDTWQSGGATDLGKGLSDVDKQINSLLQLGG